MGAGEGRGVRRLRGCLAAVGAVALCLAALAGGIWYRVEVAPTEVLTDVSPDGAYELTIDRVGEPDWPFGATHCRFTLRGEGRQILERAFSIQDDGAVARADNFAVRWRADGVQVVVSGSEQGDRVYVLGFDGSAEESEVAHRITGGPLRRPGKQKNPIAWRTKRSDSTGADDRI